MANKHPISCAPSSPTTADVRTPPPTTATSCPLGRAAGTIPDTRNEPSSVCVFTILELIADRDYNPARIIWSNPPSPLPHREAQMMYL